MRYSATLLVFLVALFAWPSELSDAPQGFGPLASADVSAPPPKDSAHPAVPAGVVAAIPEIEAQFRRTAERLRPGQRDGRVSTEEPRPPASALRLALLEQAGVLRAHGEAFEVEGIEHRPLRLYKGGMPVLNRRLRIHSDEEAHLGDTGLAGTPPFAEPTWRIDRGEALAIARSAVSGALRAEPRAERGWLAGPRETHPAWRVGLATHQPLASWVVSIDARDGEVISTVDRMLGIEGSGSVHDPNPIQAPIPTTVVLTDLDDSHQLSGSFVRVVDLSAPDAYRPGRNFEFPVGDPRFIQTSVYWTATRAAKRAISRGLPRASFPITAWVNLTTASGDPYNNAFYDPEFQLIAFGNGDGTVLANVATDADVAAHEMGHHIFETLVQPEISSSADPAAAMHEGFADVWAALVNGDPDIGESVVPGGPPLREIQTNRSFPDDDVPGSPHETGLIYSSTAWDLVGKLGAKNVERILMAGLPFVPPTPEPIDFRRALLLGDKAVTKGRYKKTIKNVTNTHGFPETDRGSQYRGILDDGVTKQGRLSNKRFVYWNYPIPPGAVSVRITMTGSNDVDLLVLGPDTDPDDPSTFLVSSGPGSNETITVTRFTRPSIDDLVLGVAILDNPNDGRASNYQMTATATLGATDLTLGGPTATGNLGSFEQIDFFTFNATAGDHVRVDVASISPGLDLIAVVVDDDFDSLGQDDDSGPGADPLIEGVPISSDGRYAVAILAWFDDVDPRRSLGSYTVGVSLCANVGTDTDADGSADTCDDDDDGDGFGDSIDASPLDAFRCFDIEADGCDDCTSGSFDPFADGPDTDGDSICDLGDPDDDSDGCLDAVDPFPLIKSSDRDHDFISADCDVCPVVSDPAQLDIDGDGLGDRCSSCNPVQWSAPIVDPPDQNPRRTSLVINDPRKPGSQDLKIVGEFNPAAPAVGVDHTSGALLGVHLRVEDARGTWLDLNIPDASVAGCDPADGWVTVDAFTSEYRNMSGALPPSCLAGSAAELTSLTLYDTDRSAPARSNAIGYTMKIINTRLAFWPTHKAVGLRFSLAFGNPIGPGWATPEARAGWCSEWNQVAGGIKCRKVKKRGKVKKISCS